MPIYEPVLILKPEMVQIHPSARVDQWVKIEGGLGVWIGEHCHISSFCTINAGGGEVVFGAHSGCASGVRICGAMPDLSYLHISPAEPIELHHKLGFRTLIGEYVVIFSNVVICPGVQLGTGCVIGAGAIVTKDVPEFEIWAGNPAQKIGLREIHAERLPVLQL